MFETVRSFVPGLPYLAKFSVVVAVMVGNSAPRASRRHPRNGRAAAHWRAPRATCPRFFRGRSAIAKLFAELGKLLLMFFAGLAVDVALLRKAEVRAIVFAVVMRYLSGVAVGGYA
ncbi:MAG TPA: hypothetical protein PLD10_11420 [Rhodopila sp.]|nr:hypothetical protein [Rhodopila sp.]